MNAKEVLAQICASGKRFYVYVLKRPNGVPFYVGIGTGRRIFDHGYYAARGKIKSHKIAIIRKIIASGQEISFGIECHSDDRSLIERRERELIAEIGRADHHKGPLANNTDGGEGAHNPSPEELKKRGAALKEWWATRPDREAFLAQLRSPEARAARSKAMTGRKLAKRKFVARGSAWMTQEMREARAARLRENPISKRPEVAAKISASKLGKPLLNSWMKTEAGKAHFARAKHPRARPIEVEGRRFGCIEDAADAFSLSRSAICNWLNRAQRGARYL